MFLVLFLFTLVMHAKPCFYCIILLATLFLSTCYWTPLSLDAPLSQPWTENITTFADALKSTLSPSYSRPLPSLIQPADRCWCDISTTGFFEPFNATQWELHSVVKLRDSLERQDGLKKEHGSSNDSAHGAQSRANDENPKSNARSSPTSIAKGIWTLLRSRRLPSNSPAEPVPAPAISDQVPFRRREFDLRRLGVDLVLDFGTGGS
ncbi:hypothetical protein D9757_002136 [Collybiopsis confluens]|uniref:Uncharacterized protein n=1 Tax=Collybiopsis confluens TaxID=2823264 RepID=A0A8H5HZV3_9AGAR|nr:hypothetical protein D9757_002136 [Collybiopsis confluens]